MKSDTTTFDATSAKNRFGQVLEAAARGPVAIERHGRVVAYVVVPKDFPSPPANLGESLAARMRAAGAVYATVFGSVSRATARPDSDIDVAVSFGKPMSSDLRMAVTGLIAEVAGRSVDLIDLEKAEGTILAQALGGEEILCDSVATRQRMVMRLHRSEDERRSVAMAARQTRKSLFA
jgi:predicted nucleotidyltransferase